MGDESSFLAKITLGDKPNDPTTWVRLGIILSLCTPAMKLVACISSPSISSKATHVKKWGIDCSKVKLTNQGLSLHCPKNESTSFYVRASGWQLFSKKLWIFSFGFSFWVFSAAIYHTKCWLMWNHRQAPHSRMAHGLQSCLFLMPPCKPPSPPPWHWGCLWAMPISGTWLPAQPGTEAGALELKIITPVHRRSSVLFL